MSGDGNNRGRWRVIVGISVILGILAALATIIFPFLPKGQFNSSDNQSGSSSTLTSTISQSGTLNAGPFPTVASTGSGNTGSTGSASTPEGLRVSPTSFTVIRSIGTSGCNYFPNHGWTCTVNLYNTTTSQLNWNAAVPNGSSITVEPSSTGFILANDTWSPDISIPDMSCPAQADITFSVQGGDSVVVHWSCTG